MAKLSAMRPLHQLLLLLLLSWTATAAPARGRGEERISAAEIRLLAQWMSISSGSGGINEFSGRLTSPPNACAPAPAPAPASSDSTGDAWRVRVRTATGKASVVDDEWTFSEGRSLDIAVASSISVLTPRPAQNGSSATGPTVYHSVHLDATFAVSRIGPLELQHCERVEKIFTDAEFRDIQTWSALQQLLSAPERFSEVLHHGYSRGWQLWLRSDHYGCFVEALAVRVLHEATRVCSVERRWTLVRSADGDRLKATVQEFQHDLNSKDEVFRLPTACYRVEL